MFLYLPTPCFHPYTMQLIEYPNHFPVFHFPFPKTKFISVVRWFPLDSVLLYVLLLVVPQGQGLKRCLTSINTICMVLQCEILEKSDL